MIKVDWLASGVLLIPGIGSCSKMQIPQIIGKQGPHALTNKKQENVDQIYADNL
jgi:hypothetical protein